MYGNPKPVRLALALTLAMASALAGRASAAEPLFSHLRVIVPSGPGGGLDTTARALQLVLPAAGVARTSSVENVPGGAGLIGLTHFVSSERAAGDVVLMGGSGMFGAALAYRSPITFADVTPIALLVSEYLTVMVRSDSPYRKLDDLIRAFRNHPESISWAGGQAGGVEQLAAWQIAAAVGVDPGRVTFIPFAGGGEMMPALLGGQISVGMNYAMPSKPYIDAGTVRALALSSPQRLPGFDVPTLREQGINVEFENWRALAAPPGITPADRQRLESAAQALAHSAEWRDLLPRYGWTDRFLAGPALAQFLVGEETRVREIVRKVGSRAVAGSTSGSVYPTIVLSSLVAVALIFVYRTRSRHLHVEPSGAGARAVVPIAVAMLVSIAAIEALGFVLTAAGLFWITAKAFDATHPIRDAAWAAGLSIGAYLLFARLLELPLPAGVLAGWR
jgi:putative tricarboxylic transport membrane protein